MVILGVVADLHRQAVLRRALEGSAGGIVFFPSSEVLSYRGAVPGLIIVDCGHGLAMLASIRRGISDAKLLAIIPDGVDPEAYARIADGIVQEPLSPATVRVAVEILLPQLVRCDGDRRRAE
jgi:hypothetical protein